MAPDYDLIDGVAAENALADKAYDADGLFKKIIDQGGDPVEPKGGRASRGRLRRWARQRRRPICEPSHTRAR